MDKKLTALTIAAMTLFAVFIVAPAIASPPWAESDEWMCSGDCVGQQDADGDGIPNCEDLDYEPLGDAYMWRARSSSKGFRKGGSNQKGYNGNCPNQ